MTNNDYVLTHRVEGFGSFAETDAIYNQLVGHLPDHEIQSARLSFSENANPNANPSSFVEVRVYQAGRAGEAEDETVWIAESGRIFQDLKRLESLELDVKRGVPFYMGALVMRIETKHTPGGGFNAPWKGIGDMVLTLHLKSKEV